MLQKTTRFDSTVGGYRAVVRLTASGRAWRYERAVLGSRVEEGIEKS